MTNHLLGVKDRIHEAADAIDELLPKLQQWKAQKVSLTEEQKVQVMAFRDQMAKEMSGGGGGKDAAPQKNLANLLTNMGFKFGAAEDEDKGEAHCSCSGCVLWVCTCLSVCGLVGVCGDGLCLRLGPHHCGGQRTGYGVLWVCYIHTTACTSVLRLLSDWTLGAAAYPSKKLAMSVRRHTEGAR